MALDDLAGDLGLPLGAGVDEVEYAGRGDLIVWFKDAHTEQEDD